MSAGTANGPLLLGDGDRQLLATFAATTTQDLATGFGLHPLAEAMGSFSTDSAGLVGPLHKILLDLGAKGLRGIALGKIPVNVGRPWPGRRAIAAQLGSLTTALFS